MIAVPLSTVLGLNGLFWMTAVLAGIGILLVFSLPETQVVREESLQKNSSSPIVWLFALSVFLLHAMMTLLFIVLPGMLVSKFGFELEYHWRIYIPSVLGSVILVFPILRRIQAGNKEYSAMPVAFLVLGVSLGLISLGGTIVTMIVFAMVFFLAFNMLEAAMPSAVSKLTGATDRGKKMGLYTTFQFLGAFAGGLGGGWLLGYSGDVVTLGVAGLLCALWAITMLVWLKPYQNGQQT
jgi:predicted MFS family arabinose efflux permease